MQCSGADRLTHLRLKINNVFRQYLRLSVHSGYDAREQLLYLTADDPDIQSQPGWTRVHTDKLDRKQVRDTGPMSFSVPRAGKLRQPDWLLEALRRSLNPHHAFPRTSILDERDAHGFDLGELLTITPVDTVDHHLINKLTSFLGIEIVVDPNPVSPLLKTHYLTPERFLEEKSTTSRPILSAPPNSITKIPKWYWYGERRCIPSKNKIPSHLYLGLDNYNLPESD